MCREQRVRVFQHGMREFREHVYLQSRAVSDSRNASVSHAGLGLFTWRFIHDNLGLTFPPSCARSPGRQSSATTPK